MTNFPQHIWLLSDGKAGHLNQLRALAGVINTCKTSNTARIHEISWQPPNFLASLTKQTGVPFLRFSTKLLPHDMPQIVLSIGKVGIVAQALIKKHFAPQKPPFCVHLMTTGRLNTAVDLEILMRHDLHPNKTPDSRQILCTVPPSPMALPDKSPPITLPNLGSGKRFALLLGGNNRAFSLEPKAAENLGRRIAKMLKEQNAKIFITPSRRTPEASLTTLQSLLEPDSYYCWDMTGENPYRSMIANADCVIVSEDSISMQSDVVHAGKPLYVAALESTILWRILQKSNKYRLFTKTLIEQGFAKEFDSICAPFPPPPCTETHSLAMSILRHAQFCDTCGNGEEVRK